MYTKSGSVTKIMSPSHLLFIMFVITLARISSAEQYQPTSESFELWKAKHRFSYTSSEHEHRFAVWLENLAKVTAHNARAERGEVTYRMAMNIHGALTNQEYRQLRLRPRVAHPTPASAVPANSYSWDANWTRPESVNWVEEGLVPGIKDQGSCGSCWAFSAVAAMEGAYNRKNQQLNGVDPACTSKCGPSNVSCCSFSEQEVADCTLSGADTCDIGGEPHDGILEVVAKNGKISTEQGYPYVSGNTGKLTRCNTGSSIVSTGITGYQNITSGDEDALTDAIATHGVISVGIDASSFGFQLYDSGIYVDDTCKNTPKALDHGVAVVGYGSGDPTPPGPTPPPPGPSDCKNNFKKPMCEGEKGCHWCVDEHQFGYCLNEPCPSSSVQTKPKSNDYYIVRNSWNMDWGMGGYMAFAKGRNNMCGIATDAVYAVIG